MIKKMVLHFEYAGAALHYEMKFTNEYACISDASSDLRWQELWPNAFAQAFDAFNFNSLYIFSKLFARSNTKH